MALQWTLLDHSAYVSMRNALRTLLSRKLSRASRPVGNRRKLGLPSATAVLGASINAALEPFSEAYKRNHPLQLLLHSTLELLSYDLFCAIFSRD
jgi:hypothetical protein